MPEGLKVCELGHEYVPGNGCTKCRRTRDIARKAAYRKNNRVKLRLAYKTYWEANKESVRKANRAYQTKNLERKRKANRDYHANKKLYSE